MKYYIIVGEASGDLHGSKLIEGIKKRDKDADFRFWGGDKMIEACGNETSLVKHIKETSIMGFIEVVKNLRTILSQISYCKKDILNYAPDVVILVDYAGFNLKIAKFAKLHNIKTYYYIAPKVWAWKENRVKKIKKWVDELFVIFPFEVEYFKKWGIEAHYFGNPIMDAIEEKNAVLSSKEEFIKENNLDNKKKIALLPGSRVHEINYNLSFILNVAKEFKDYQFVICGVNWIDEKVYRKLISSVEGVNVELLFDKTYETLAHSDAAIVTSGTATLETALLKVPEFSCYWVKPITAFILSFFLKLKWVTLVNIIMQREVIAELLYKNMVVEKGVEELRAILPGGSKHDRLMADYDDLEQKMGDVGASKRVAHKIVSLLETKN
ncbi:MAG: lipid-A-disaccharide synthase [Rikenellaceae bacterium]